MFRKRRQRRFLALAVVLGQGLCAIIFFEDAFLFSIATLERLSHSRYPGPSVPNCYPLTFPLGRTLCKRIA